MKFSIGAILALTAFVAWLTAILFVFSDVAASICLLILNPMISAALLSAAIYGRHVVRAFCIGAAGPTLLMVAFHSWLVAVTAGLDTSPGDVGQQIKELGDMALYLKFQTVVVVVIALAGGLTGVFVRWLLRPRC